MKKSFIILLLLIFNSSFSQNEYVHQVLILNEGYLDFAGSDIHNFSHVSGFDKKVLIKNIDSFEKIINKNEVFN